MSDATRAVGVRLRYQRETVGLSQHRLADLAGTTQAHVSGIESGRRLPSYSLLCDLAEHLGVTPVWLLYGDGEHTCPMCTRGGATRWRQETSLIAS